MEPELELLEAQEAELDKKIAGFDDMTDDTKKHKTFKSNLARCMNEKEKVRKAIAAKRTELESTAKTHADKENLSPTEAEAEADEADKPSSSSSPVPTNDSEGDDHAFAALRAQFEVNEGLTRRLLEMKQELKDHVDRLSEQEEAINEKDEQNKEDETGGRTR